MQKSSDNSTNLIIVLKITKFTISKTKILRENIIDGLKIPPIIICFDFCQAERGLELLFWFWWRQMKI